jgi:hypothetical protein
MVQANATRSSQFLPQSGFVGFVRFVVPHLLCRAAANSTANPAELIRPRIGQIARMSGRGSVRGGQAAVIACEGGMVQANATTASPFLPQSGFVGFVRFVVPHLPCRPAANSTANPAELIRPRIGQIARMSGRGSVRGEQAAVIACKGDSPSKCDKFQSISPSIWIRGIRAIRGPPPSVSRCRELNREPSGVDSTTNRTNRTNEWSGECSW